MLMHGSVWGRAMDLMLWKRGKKKDARRESSEGKERETKSKK